MEITAKIRHIGNSFGVIIPKYVLEGLDLAEDGKEISLKVSKVPPQNESGDNHGLHTPFEQMG